MLSSDKYARHKLLGETDLKLGDIELRHPIRIWMNLRDMDEVSCPGRQTPDTRLGRTISTSKLKKRLACCKTLHRIPRSCL